jgi:hypothetical protein
MVTSALVESFLSHGSTWQLLGEVSLREEDDGASEGIGSLTEPESRDADAHEGEGENSLDGSGKYDHDQSYSEARDDLRIRRSL